MGSWTPHRRVTGPPFWLGEPPQTGWVAHVSGQATAKGQQFIYLFILSLGFGGGRTTTVGLGVASATPDRPVWVSQWWRFGHPSIF